MARKSDTSPDPIDVWARLQRASGAVLARVESCLKAEGFPPLAWYDILLELRRADGKALRPVEIEKRILLAQYNVSRLIDRLVAAGYVDKRKSPEDGRGVVICLLPEGEALLEDLASGFVSFLTPELVLAAQRAEWIELTRASQSDTRLLGAFDQSQGKPYSLKCMLDQFSVGVSYPFESYVELAAKMFAPENARGVALSPEK